MPSVDLTQTHVISGSWLESKLPAPELRVLDATVILDPNSWQANSGLDQWKRGHVPGSAFIDLIEDVSDPAGDEGLPPGIHAYRLPSAEQFARVLGSYGVTESSPVVVYDSSAGMWASRLWWLLRYFGNDNVAVLDGGWDRWVAEGRPVSTDPAPSHPAATFTVRIRPELLATKDDVIAAIDANDTVLVNALWPELFRGEAKTPLPRPGRIPGSVNVPFTETVDASGLLRQPRDLRRLFDEAGASADKRVITYCGGGIAASFDALALAQCGVDAALYDGSLVEWVADEDLPLETG